MSFEYHPRDAYFHEAYFRARLHDHLLVYSDRGDTHSDSLGFKNYDIVTSNIAEQLGPAIELWNEDRLLHPNAEQMGDSPVWQVAWLVPLVFAFRTKEDAFVAKLSIGSNWNAS